MQTRVIREKQDLTYLNWSHIEVPVEHQALF